MSWAPFGIVPDQIRGSETPESPNSNNTLSSENTSSYDHTKSSVALTVMLPALIAVILLVLVIISVLLPRFISRSSSKSREKRKRSRVASLNKSIKVENFRDWKTKEIKKRPDVEISADMTCVICLETIEDAARVRGLRCCHVYHQTCIDSWYGESHESCPLCHRPIMPVIVNPGKHSISPTTENEREEVRQLGTSMV